MHIRNVTMAYDSKTGYEKYRCEAFMEGVSIGSPDHMRVNVVKGKPIRTSRLCKWSCYTCMHICTFPNVSKHWAGLFKAGLS